MLLGSGKSQLNVLLSRYWINLCYNWLHHRHALQALHDPQWDLHGRRTSFSEIQVDLQEPPENIRNVSKNVTYQRTGVGARIALASLKKIRSVEDGNFWGRIPSSHWEGIGPQINMLFGFKNHPAVYSSGSELNSEYNGSIKSWEFWRIYFTTVFIYLFTTEVCVTSHKSELCPCPLWPQTIILVSKREGSLPVH